MTCTPSQALRLAQCPPVIAPYELTSHHFREHAEHREFFARHFVVKGEEVVRGCVATLPQLQGLK